MAKMKSITEYLLFVFELLRSDEGEKKKNNGNERVFRASVVRHFDIRNIVFDSAFLITPKERIIHIFQFYASSECDLVTKYQITNIALYRSDCSFSCL